MESQYRTSLRGTFCVEADTQSHNYHCLRLLRLKKSRNDVLNKAFTYNRNSHNILTYIKSNVYNKWNFISKKAVRNIINSWDIIFGNFLLNEYYYYR
jgi:hypothetical protein